MDSSAFASGTYIHNMNNYGGTLVFEPGVDQNPAVLGHVNFFGYVPGAPGVHQGEHSPPPVVTLHTVLWGSRTVPSCHDLFDFAPQVVVVVVLAVVLYLCCPSRRLLRL